MPELDFDEWVDVVAKSAEEWFDLNGMDMIRDQSQVNHIQSALDTYGLNPENQQMTTDHKPAIKQQVFIGMERWATETFDEKCPDCEKVGIYLTKIDDVWQYSCNDNCGWTGKKYNSLRIRKQT